MNSKKSNIYDSKIKTPYNRRSSKYYFRKNIIFVLVAVCIVALLIWIKGITPEMQSGAELTPAQIIRIIDGDTFVVLLEGKDETVRLIGVDSPESVSLEEKENSIYGQYASDYTSGRLKKGQIVYLSFDEQLRDPYERLLAYVWTEPDVNDTKYLYQRQLAEDGYAVAVVYEPNSRYADVLDEAMRNAISARRGLWAYEEFYADHFRE